MITSSNLGGDKCIMKKKIFIFPRESHLKIKFFSDKKQKVRLNYKNGVLRLYDENGNQIIHHRIEFTRLRKRSNGKNKIISYIEDIDIMSLDTEKYLSDYDAIYAVDTNTKKINSVYYSIGILAKLEKEDKTYKIEVCRIITSENDIIKPEMEQAVWNSVITEIEKMETENNKIALVVDCDLGNIEAYNRREKKIRNDRFLPGNFILLYATSDTKENVLNKLICFCDKEATKLLEEKRKEMINGNTN